MSLSAGDAKKREETLRANNFQDDSLCTDEFEIISCDTLGNGAADNNDDTVSQWTTKHSINVESTIPMNNLAHILCSAHSEVPSLTSGSTFKSVAENFDGEVNGQDGQNKTQNNRDETAILVGTVNSA
ncbi:hypothetical protein OSTOST_18858, partial [Ostertagia ostertagi]